MQVRTKLLAAGFLSVVAPVFAAEPGATVARDYLEVAQPLLKSFCYDCHSGDTIEAELDLAAFPTDVEVRKHPAAWVKIRDVLTTGDMPPPEGDQPSDAQRGQLLHWVRALLAEEARLHAGDPGPVGLRRLDNSEYNYVLRDLTGLPDLDLTHEFPIDGAAGEGFTNVGSGQGMSPAMVQKYLDAAKAAAQHLELLPDGVRFTSATTQRDRTDVLLARIQEFYRRFTADGGGTAVNLQGIKFETNQGGMLAVERYLQATLAFRDVLRSGQTSIEAVAQEQGLSPKYLTHLWTALNSADAGSKRGPWLAELQRRWTASRAGDAAALAQWINAGQDALWKFNPVGQIVPGGAPRRWMEPVNPLVPSRDLRIDLAGLTEDPHVTLTAQDLGDSPARDVVMWERPRIEFRAEDGESPISAVLLRELGEVTVRSRALQASEIPRTADYLQALETVHRDGSSLETQARDANLNPSLLEQWASLTGIAGGGAPRIQGLFTRKNEQLHGYAALNGWGLPETPSLLANSSAEPITISTLTVPAHGMTLHPSPKLEAFVAWRSPIAAELHINGLAADADDKCGNGGSWRLEVHQPGAIATLAQGTFDNGGRQELHPENVVPVKVGDVVLLAVGPRDGDHSCDTTHVDLRLAEVGGTQRQWNLSTEVVDRILQGNPLADADGHPDVWHFGARDVPAGNSSALPVDTALSRWRAAVVAGNAAEAAAAAREVGTMLTAAAAESLSEPEQQLRTALLDWTGPLRWVTVARRSPADEQGPRDANAMGLDSTQFGTTPQGTPVDQENLCRLAPQRIEFRVPRELARRGEFVTTVRLHPESVGEGSVQASVGLSPFDDPGLRISEPVIVDSDSPAARRWAAAGDDFRDLFPQALCYARIVPVDEVVTLTLFFREDDHLQRLMLNDEQTAELERLWDELLFVSEEPLKLVVALEQIREFATQDRPDLVTVFDPLKEPIARRAEAFRQRQRDAESAQLEAVVLLADAVWRRPLTSDEHLGLHAFYSRLRAEELPHDEALRLTFARILTAAEFLFKVEKAPPGSEPQPISDRELANRLSFFLWSSIPDDRLSSAARLGELHQDEVLIRETRRMLQDARVRRLAIHFACQWLHVRNFATTEEKNEQLYPEFAGLRDSMAEEAVLFFEDLFRNDRSLLDVLQSDATFVDADLAALYGVTAAPEVMLAGGEIRIGAPEWRRVTGLRGVDRGGILGLAAVQASQSGASRTSPILRGNWVYETVLGEKLPKPPPGVPQLPEAVPAGLTERALIEQHSSVAACARCHVKIDPYGFALEQFDTIGRRRPQAVETGTALADGTTIVGLTGLRDYLANARRDDFVRQFCRKLLGYALGREVQLSDEPLLDEMQSRLKAGDYRVSIAVEAIVNSPQFRRIRGAESDHAE